MENHQGLGQCPSASISWDLVPPLGIKGYGREGSVVTRSQENSSKRGLTDRSGDLW